jgi:hypothetical protein
LADLDDASPTIWRTNSENKCTIAQWAANELRQFANGTREKSAVSARDHFLRLIALVSTCAFSAVVQVRGGCICTSCLGRDGCASFSRKICATPLPRKLSFTDEQKIWEIAQRGGYTLSIAGRQELQEKIRKGNGGIWLELTPEQHAKLLRTKE